jgi:hypothetical protein
LSYVQRHAPKWRSSPCKRVTFPLSPSRVDTTNLRVHHLRLCRSHARSAGIAGRSWTRSGTRVDRCSFLSLGRPYANSWRYARSESLDLSGQIHGLLVVIFCAAALHRAELEVTTTTSTYSSINKVCVASSYHGDKGKISPPRAPCRQAW